MITSMEVIKRGWVRVWSYKAWVIVGVLLLILLGLLLKIAGLSHQIDLEQTKHFNYVKSQEAETERLNREWSEKYSKAQEAYVERIQILERDRYRLNASVNRLSATLASTEAKFVKASDEAKLEYTNTLSNVFKHCAAEYRGLAERADGHANDARRLIESWPTLDKEDPEKEEPP